MIGEYQVSLAYKVINDIGANASDSIVLNSWHELLMSLGGGLTTFSGLTVNRGTMYAIALIIINGV